MPTFLHLYLIPTRDEFLIEGHVRNTSGTALTNDFKRIKCACHDVPEEIDTTQYDSNGTLNWSLDESFRGLIDDFPCSLSYIFNENVRIT
jgi:hypothetical protein